MAETDKGPAEIAVALDASTASVRRWLMRMLDGTAKDLDTVSDLALAMGRDVVVSLLPIEPPTGPVNPGTTPNTDAAQVNLPSPSSDDGA